MAFIDPTVYMMDAGMALVFSEDSFGEILGQLRAELAPYGKVLKVSDSGGKFLESVSPDDLPKTAGECDLFINRSTLLRRQYLTVKVEEAGHGKYAFKIREGHKNSPLRDFITLMICAVGFLNLLISPSLVRKAVGLALMALGGYLYFLPSSESIGSVALLKDTLHRLYPEK